MVRRVLAFVVLGGLSLIGASVADAQSFSFSIGHGHHHGWHHHHCWDDPWFWGPHVDYLYVAPPPPRVVYVQPRQVEVRTLAPQDASSRPAASSPPTAAAGTQTVQIWNGSDRDIPVAFLVDSQPIELHDGQSHSLHGSGKRIVEFDRGGTFGTARYELSGGQYEFVVTNRGWDLVRRAATSSSISLRPLVKKNVLPDDTVRR